MLDFPEMSDKKFEEASPEEQDWYNHKIALRNKYKTAYEDYEKSMSLLGPWIFIFAGIVLVMPAITREIGAGVMVVGILWVFFRVIARAQAYQLFKDMEAEFKRAIGER